MATSRSSQVSDLDRLERQADNSRNRGQTRAAIRAYRELHQQARQAGDWVRAGHALQMIGVSYKIDNATERSLRALHRAAVYFQKHGLLDDYGATLRDIGITYEYADRLAEAEQFLRESVHLLKRAKDRAQYGISVSKLGLVRLRQGEVQEAEQLLRRGVRLTRNHWFFRVTSLAHLADLKETIGDYRAAIRLCQKAIGLLDAEHQQTIHSRRYAQLWGLEAHARAQLGQFDQARLLLKPALDQILSESFSTTAAAVVLRDIRAIETVTLLAQR